VTLGSFGRQRAGVERPVPRCLFQRRNYEEISVTVLGPVHVGDITTSVLLGEPARLWMTRGGVVSFVCSGWGSAAVVHRPSSRGKSVSSLRTAISTVGGVTSEAAGSKVFLVFGRRSAFGTLTNPGGEFFDVIEDFASLGHLGEDLLLRVHDRGVVTAECLPDFRQG